MVGFRGKWASKYIDKIYNELAKLDGKDEGIAAPELYVGVLLLFNNINKYSPGKWVNPPKKSEVFKLLEKYDRNNDKVLNREEFQDFCEMFLPDLTKKILLDIVTTIVLGPALVLLLISNFKVLKIVPEALLTVIVLTFINLTGLQRVLDDWLDRMFPVGLSKSRSPVQPGVAYAYPYGAPPGTAYPYGAPPGTAYPYPPSPQVPAGSVAAASPLPSAPAAPPGTVQGIPAKPGVAVPSKVQ